MAGFLLLLAPQVLTAQSTWQTAGGGTQHEVAGAVEITSDGGYIGVGTRMDTITGDHSIWLAKSNIEGVLWERQLETLGNDSGHCVRPTADGGFVIAGTTSVQGAANALLLVKTNSSGVVTWAKTFAGSLTTGPFASVRQTVDGGYILTGFRDNGPGFVRGGVLVRTDPSGNLLWSKVYSDTAMGAAARTVFHDVRVLADGFIVVGTDRMASTTFERNLLVRTDVNGAVVWSKAYGANGIGHEKGAVEALANDGFAFTSGYTNGAVTGTCVTITDSTGALNGTYSEYPNTGYYAPCIREDHKGQLLVTTGYCGILKLNPSGTFRFGRQYFLSGSQMASAVPTHDGGIAMLAFTNYNNGSTPYDVLGIKADALGNSGCNNVGWGGPVYSTPPVFNVGLTIANNPGAANVAMTTTTVTSPIHTYCFRRGSTPPPSGMVLWLPFDEASGTVADNITGGTDGNGISSPARVAGMVGNCVSLSGSNYVEVPKYTALDIGTGNFTVDAWIRQATSGFGIIADDRVETTTSARGWSFFVSNAGTLSLQIADGAWSTFLTNAVITPGVWHHVAATVVRGSTTGLNFYVDGVLVETRNPTARTGSLTHGNPLRVGCRSSLATGQFTGEIDEVEVFRRALQPLEIRRLWEAGSFGKQKQTCGLPASKTINFNQSSVDVPFTIRNRTPVAQTYSLYARGLPIGTLPGCTTTGPSQFSLPTTVTVPPGYHTVTVTITKPFAMLTNKSGGYEVFAENTATGHTLSARGKLFHSANFSFGFSSGRFSAPNGGQALIPQMPIANLGPTTATLGYRIVVRDGNQELDTQSVSLNGLAPGSAVTGNLVLGSNQTGVIPAMTVEFVESRSEDELHLVIEADLDGDGIQDALASAELVDEVTSTSPGATPYGSTSSGMVIDVLGQPMIDQTFQVRLSGAPANSIAGLVVGFSNTSWNGAPLPFALPGMAPGNNLLASVESFQVLGTDANGAASLSITLPNIPGLVGAHLFCQWLAVPTGPGGLLATTGLDVVVGG